MNENCLCKDYEGQEDCRFCQIFYEGGSIKECHQESLLEEAKILEEQIDNLKAVSEGLAIFMHITRNLTPNEITFLTLYLNHSWGDGKGGGEEC